MFSIENAGKRERVANTAALLIPFWLESYKVAVNTLIQGVDDCANDAAERKVLLSMDLAGMGLTEKQLTGLATVTGERNEQYYLI